MPKNSKRERKHEMGNKNAAAAVIDKIRDRMLLGAIYDTVIRKTRYRGEKLDFRYNVIIGQKHRMLYYKRLRKKYFAQAVRERNWETSERVKNSDTIWFCWLQGMEEAPLLVKRCYDSLREQLPGKNIIVLTKDNLGEYVTIPEDILEKWRKGILSNAHFSDILRLELLIRHGGYWIDSTVYCTKDKFSAYIDDQPLFLYSWYYFGFSAEIMELNNWFMYSFTNDPILCLTRKLLYAYWRENDRACDYFLTQLFLTMACEYYEEAYARMPIVSQADAHILATYMGQPFDKTKFELLKESTGIHKLSHKFTDKDKGGPGSFYDVLIRQGSRE